MKTIFLILLVSFHHLMAFEAPSQWIITYDNLEDLRYEKVAVSPRPKMLDEKEDQSKNLDVENRMLRSDIVFMKGFLGFRTEQLEKYKKILALKEEQNVKISVELAEANAKLEV